MANKDLLKKIGLGIMGIIIVAGVMLFIFKDNTQETVPANNDFAITTEIEAEDTPAEVGLIEDEVKFNEVEMPTVEETTEEIVEEIVEDSDTLPGITVIEESTESLRDSDLEDNKTEDNVGTKEDNKDSEIVQDNTDKGNQEQSTENSSDNSNQEQSTESGTTEQGNSNGEQSSVHETTGGSTNQGNGNITDNTPTPPAQDYGAIFGDMEFIGSGPLPFTGSYGGSGNVE